MDVLNLLLPGGSGIAVDLSLLGLCIVTGAAFIGILASNPGLQAGEG